MNHLLIAAILATSVTCAPLTAAAEPLEVDLTATVSGLVGTHVTGGGAATTIVAPLPLAELDLRRGADALHVEGIPPVGIPTAEGGASSLTRLSLLNLVYRRTLAGGWFAGAGETVYNQHTYFSDGEEQASRVAGLRLETGYGWHAGRSHVEASLAYNPVMHGLLQTTFSYRPGVTFRDGERGPQIDTAVRVAQPLGRHSALVYGLRYINYSSRFDAQPGLIVDRNAGIAPVVGYKLRL